MKFTTIVLVLIAGLILPLKFLGSFGVAIGLVTLIVAFFLGGLKFIPQNHLAVVHTWGYYSHTAGPPAAWIIPGIQKLGPIVDARDRALDIALAGVHTSDGIPLTMTLKVLYRCDPGEIPDRQTAASLTSFLPGMAVFEGIIRTHVAHALRAHVGSYPWRRVCSPAGRAALEAALVKGLSPRLRQAGVLLSPSGGVLIGCIALPDDLQKGLELEAMLQRLAQTFGCSQETVAQIVATLELAQDGTGQTIFSLPVWGNRRVAVGEAPFMGHSQPLHQALMIREGQ